MPVSPAALDKRTSQPKLTKAQGKRAENPPIIASNQIEFLFLDGKIGIPERQNSGPIVVKASKDKKKINQKVCIWSAFDSIEWHLIFC